MTFQWSFAWEVLPQLLVALRITALATVLGMVLASVLGLAWELLRRMAPTHMAAVVRVLVEFIRSTPLLVQIYFFFYIAPDFGLRTSPLTTGILALGLHYSAYLAEVYRAGIDGVPRGQWEAARALNLNPAHTWLAIILPQALPPVIPAWGNYVVAMFKDTPMLSAITVLELLQTAKIIGSDTFRYLEPLTLVGLLFLALSLAAAVGIRWAERHFQQGRVTS